MILPLKSTPSLDRVDTALFTRTYFAACMDCNFCHDSCCQYGADVTVIERDRILANAESIKQVVTTPVDQWFEPEVYEDDDYQGGSYVRAAAVNGACAFRNPNGRGCGLHLWALKTGRDYHDIKPAVCWLFPVIWDHGLLRPNRETEDELVCLNQGQTLYRGARSELAHFFGEALVQELDEIERTLNASGVPAEK